ncbi:DUF5107 domain-containing protein, partial [bacterium]|nr:DUF5107 domain-containing protein [bacterium]
NQKEEKTYNALYLENEYIKLCILPELGGRLFYATDKTNGYELFYRQHVIKPSQIGMLGAWISGGIEWCVFHHHRASTFMPMNYRLVENQDGSKTIWFGEIEPRQRMKWSIGISLFPGSSRIEAKIRMLNRTDTTNSILYWANVATHVNDDYQVFFPPSTEYGVYHSKNEFVHWPIARTRYRGVDYKGVDLSWWKNHPNPVSIFAHDLKEGFLGGYDHGKDAGVVHVANPNIVKGAKLWEWGPGPEGSMWDTKVLTDSDGPYAELMAGAYSDNQPDYSWIKPYETKEAIQTWYPLREIGGVKSANQNAAVNLVINDDKEIVLGYNATQGFSDAVIRLTAKGKTLLDETTDISPSKPFVRRIALPDGVVETDLQTSLASARGKTLIEYTPIQLDVPDELPETVEPPQKPEEIASVEELYFTGLRIKQFHNARLNSMDYFEEALKRDPLDSRANIQMGLDAAKRGKFEDAEAYFSKAVERISKNYTRPRDCEAYYQLGLVQKKQGNFDDAYENLFRAVWDAEFRGAAYFNLAEIESLRGNYHEALALVDKSLEVNTLNTKALGLKSAWLRNLKQARRASRITERALRTDPLDFLARNERALAALQRKDEDAADADFAELRRLLKDDPESYLELAQDYMNAGLNADAMKVLNIAAESDVEALRNYPTLHYTLAYLYHLKENDKQAKKQLVAAQNASTDYCFPYRLETVSVLQYAIETNPQDSRAYYYLGNLLYDMQPEKAMEYWKESVKREPTLAIAYRNLGWAYYDVDHDFDQAIASYETAIQHNPFDPRYYYELDKLYEGNQTPVEKRIQILEANHEVVAKSESALTRAIIALVQGEQYDKAIQYLDDYYFHIQEGNRRLHDTYADAHMLRGVDRLQKGDAKKALEDFLAADEYPENHQMGRDRNYERDPQIFYYAGLAYQTLGDEDKAKEFFDKTVNERIRSARTYSYYQGLAYRALGDESKAIEIFDSMIDSGEKSLGASEGVDFFAKFGEGERPSMREADALYLMGLGYLGKGDNDKAKEALAQVVKRDVYNNWARVYLK